ncbi:hypothetical protein [Chromobacterium violaceum]|uniref:hypothetical protein n=1 Tax=Chromobacterium violaceum TaxID=536 RepID=UPI00111C8460|nr:hypothetical protein [Chromobacterium violaceum]QRO32452.1 hypothetical protein I6K04_18480 [Chromobacterium violaceum]QRQ17748.1 hypothetical protein I6K03_04250 [Chromobacterium violaceum]
MGLFTQGHCGKISIVLLIFASPGRCAVSQPRLPAGFWPPGLSARASAAIPSGKLSPRWNCAVCSWKPDDARRNRKRGRGGKHGAGGMPRRLPNQGARSVGMATSACRNTEGRSFSPPDLVRFALDKSSVPPSFIYEITRSIND